MNSLPAPALLQHGLAALMAWPLRSKIISIIHHHTKYKVTVEHVPGQLICARCNQVPNIPKKTSCGKTVCRKCVGYNNQCPFCTNSSCIASRNSDYAQQISKLRAKCPTPQCKWHGRVEEVTEHLQRCADVTVTCPQCGTKVLRKLQFQHNDCCPLQIRNCFYCRKEGIAKDILLHERTECPWRKVECPYECGNLDIFHDKLDIHVQDLCLLRPVFCKRCSKEYIAEDFVQHWCVPSISTQPQPNPESAKTQANYFSRHYTLPADYNHTEMEPQSSNASRENTCTQNFAPPATDRSNMKGNLPQADNPTSENATTLTVTIPIAKYTTLDNSKSKAEALQRLVVSCITLCLLSTVAYLRNQRITDVQFEHDMEIPSVLLWSIFTSTIVFLVVLGGSSCYKNLFKAINTKEWIVIALAISVIHLTRFYRNACFPIILGSLCGSTFEVFLFYKHIKTFPGQSKNTIWVMTQFIAIVLAPFIIIYYSSISNLRVAIMQLVYVIYIMILREKQRLEICWNNMTQENRTIGAFLVNGVVLFSITLYSVTAISYEVFSTSCSSLKIILVAVLPVAYFYIMAIQEVQDKMLEFGEKLYKSSIYSFWGRLCMVSTFYYTMTICLIIPIVQETGDFVVGSALASVLIVYSIIVQTGIFSENGVKEILEESDTLDNPIEWHEILLTDNQLNCCILLKVRFVETPHDSIPNVTTLSLFAELERLTSDVLINETAIDDLVFTLSLSVTNEQWTSSNETISFSSQDIFGPALKNKLGCASLEQLKRERYLNSNNAITLSIQLSH